MKIKITSKEQGLKLLKYITQEKKDITNIYLYAILNGMVQLSVPLGIQSIISFVMGATMVTSIYILIFFVVLGTWLVGYFKVKVMQIIEKIQQKMFVEFSVAFAEKIPKVDLLSARKYYLPEMVNRFFDTQNMQKGISKILLEIPTAVIQIVFGILLLAFYHPWFLAFGLLVVIGIVLIFRFTMDSGIQSSIEESDKKYETASWIEDIASSVKTFKIFSRTNTHIKGIDEKAVEYLKHRNDHFQILVFQYKTIVGFKVVITLAMLAIGTYLLVHQKLNVGAFIATEIVVLSIMTAAEKLIKSLESYYDLISAYAKLSKVTEFKEEENGEIQLNAIGKGLEIEFRNVGFSFNDQPILNNINCNLPENSITVISGKLGAGKSLFLNMLAGFYAPTSGTIFFDKIPLQNIEKTHLREKMGLYLDDMKIIKGTVLDNILIGKNEHNLEDVLALSEKIGIENISSLFSSGFYTDISETDTEISFSSKKKILLLRALMGNKRLLIMEDPVDGLNENIKTKMMSYLQQLKSQTTIVLVSQDEDLQRMADQHLNLENGTFEIKK